MLVAAQLSCTTVIEEFKLGAFYEYQMIMFDRCLQFCDLQSSITDAKFDHSS